MNKKDLLRQAINAIEKSKKLHSDLYTLNIDISNLESDIETTLLKFIDYFCFDCNEITSSMFSDWVYPVKKKELVIYSKKDDIKHFDSKTKITPKNNSYKDGYRFQYVITKDDTLINYLLSRDNPLHES